MPTKKQAETPQTPPLVRPGERAVLLSHHEYQLARSLGQGLENYDLLMREPDDTEDSDEATPESERWMPIRSDKYLKHRATGWREAQSAEELPDRWRDTIADRDPFPVSEAAKGGE